MFNSLEVLSSSSSGSGSENQQKIFTMHAQLIGIATMVNGPLARNVKYFNDMQIARDVTTGSLPNVWRQEYIRESIQRRVLL